MLGEVIRLWRSDGRFLDLRSTDILRRGGEGTIYTLPDFPELVAKVYHVWASDPSKKNSLLRRVDRLAKLRAMIDDPPENPRIEGTQNHVSIAWPCDLLFASEARAEVRGFLMPRVNGMKPLLEFYNPKARRHTCPQFNYRYLVQMARNLAISVRNLHAKNYVIGDLNELNVLGSLTALVTLVDTDSFQVPDPQHQIVHRCPVGRPEYTPPELQGIRFEHVDRKPKHDLFGLAVLIFQLLMEGTHPFNGRFPRRSDQPTWEERISTGGFPYCRRRKAPCQPMRWAPPFAVLAPKLQDLFLRCFEEGHHDPQLRPDAEEWHQALDEVLGALTECTNNNNHIYSNHLTCCPWCERIQSFHYDSFSPMHQRSTHEPSVVAMQRPLPPPSKSRLTRAASWLTSPHVPPKTMKKRTIRWSSVLLAVTILFGILLFWVSRSVDRGLSLTQKPTPPPVPAQTQSVPGRLVSELIEPAAQPAPVPWVPPTQHVPPGIPPVSQEPVSPPPTEPPALPGQRILEDLVEVVSADNVPLGGHAAGNEEASQRQWLAAQQLGLPVEVKTRRTGIVLRFVPAGSFTMGSPPGEKGRRRDETQHEVTLTTPFFCAKYEVTRAQWEQVMGAGLSDADGKEGRGDVPKDQVSWEDCQVFLRQLCQVESVPRGTYRLLTEAQWEYACRADTVTPFHHGNYLYPSMANFNGAYARDHDRERQWQDVLIPVGSKKPNAWGLYDLHGNALEWCADLYGLYASNAPEIDPEGPDRGDHRVARGGAWMSKEASCRSAARDSFRPERRSDYLGFRLMRLIPRSANEER